MAIGEKFEYSIINAIKTSFQAKFQEEVLVKLKATIQLMTS